MSDKNNNKKEKKILVKKETGSMGPFVSLHGKDYGILTVVKCPKTLTEFKEVLNRIQSDVNFRCYIESSIFQSVPLASTNKKKQANLSHTRYPMVSLNKYDIPAYMMYLMLEKDEAKFRDRQEREYGIKIVD